MQRKILSGILCFSILVIVSLSVGCAGKNHDREKTQSKLLIIIAEGEAAGKTDTPAATLEKMAITVAKKNALEQAGGYMKAQTRIDMFRLAEDMIDSWSEGFVRVVEVLDKKTSYDEKAGGYRSFVKIKAEVLLPDIEEFKKHLDDEERSGSQKELTFEFNIIAERQLLDGTWEDVLVQDGSLLNTGDRFQIIFKPHSDCYLYIINVDSKKNVYMLFPHAQAKIGNFLKNGEDYSLPDKNKFYQLDSTAGIETLYFAASYTPMKDIEWLLKKALIADGDGSLALLDSAIKKRGSRGASRIVTGKERVYTLSDGKEIRKAADILQGNGSVVKIVWFHHN